MNLHPEFEPTSFKTVGGDSHDRWYKISKLCYPSGSAYLL